MNENKQEYSFNVEKFKQKCKSNNLTLKDAGLLIGRSSSFWSVHCKKGTVSRSDLAKFHEHLRMRSIEKEQKIQKTAKDIGYLVQKEMLHASFMVQADDPGDKLSDLAKSLFDMVKNKKFSNLEAVSCINGLKITIKIEEGS